jgi:hypothetical protein
MAVSTSDAIIREAILGKVPADGSTIGNQTLLTALETLIDGMTEEDYWRVRGSRPSTWCNFVDGLRA